MATLLVAVMIGVVIVFTRDKTEMIWSVIIIVGVGA